MMVRRAQRQRVTAAARVPSFRAQVSFQVGGVRLKPVGQELSIGPAGRRETSPAAGARPVSRVVWTEHEAALDASIDPVPPVTALQPVVDVSFLPHRLDAEEVIATLHAERAASRAGFNHPHAASGCVFCRRAAAAYR
jgi:hypothetical protein